MILALKKTLGLDRAILYVLLNRGWTLLAGFVTLYLISATMSKAEQGYYYTFSSILALQIFFELGFSGIIAQFASHEMAKLHWRGGDIVGDSQSRQRLLSLFRLAIKWYGVISLLTVFLLNTAGFYFFSSSARQSGVDWHLPWMLLTLGATLNLFLSPLLALFEGSGLVANVSALRLMQSMVAYSSGWLLLLNDGKLYTAAAISIMTAAVGFYWLGKHYGAFLKSLLQNLPGKDDAGICWRREIWPMQWRIALSWLSGYFISQLFTPLAFRYQGTEAAGQLGMSLSIVTTMSTVASAWLTTKLPSFGMLIAGRQAAQLMALFRKSSLQSIAVLLAQHSLFFILLLAMRHYQFAFASRLLEPIDILWLLLAAQACHIVFLQAAYIRAHKIEPYLKHAILLALLISSSSYYLIQHYSIREMLALYAIICGTVGVGYSSYIYASFNKRKMAGQ
ncbi:hypothetical protein KIF53_15020 [Chromobacterium subtsugae]|uniref:Polysaccharide biosynthesis protein n=1 Tax=Chromobacterium subtsugae TaxID=251747 RepID=A0ABS7FFU7_9NEIS|nr:hypothetical protein [Chromobacterium subtsugae]KUM03991.1 hypothetical protein Cv017_16900 [Chromobacterium subtsugae]MBW8288945.1 hypothetical protein [Chromobacterium subtsugae]WSE91262.1 hypothetical protein U6115_20670 [Chromobacterium subtsugae]WVH59637.1 hypothetical protein U6151_20700 [Chromobacterium subtsugae]